MDEKIKTSTLLFSAKGNPNMEKAFFDWPIVLQYDVKAKYRLTSRKFFGIFFFSPERSLNQAKATRVCIRSINQTNRSISVRIRLLLLFCSGFFVSRSYENRSNNFRALFLGTLIQSFRIQLQKKLPTFDELNEMELARLSLRQRKFTL